MSFIYKTSTYFQIMLHIIIPIEYWVTNTTTTACVSNKLYNHMLLLLRNTNAQIPTTLSGDKEDLSNNI